MVFGIRFLHYGRSKEGIGYGFFGDALKLTAFSGCLIPAFLSLLLGWKAFWLNACFVLISAAILFYYKRRMNCITGDMLGAMAEALESLLFLLSSVGGGI